MTAKKSKAKFSAVTRADYDASRDKPRSGTHKNPGVLVRAPELEGEQWKRWAKRAGVSRVDFVRVACALASDVDGAEIRDALELLEQYAAKKDRARNG